MSTHTSQQQQSTTSGGCEQRQTVVRWHRHGCQFNHKQRQQQQQNLLLLSTTIVLFVVVLFGAQENLCLTLASNGEISSKISSSSSELSFDNQGLKSIPAVQLCSMANSDQSAHINVVSLANNNIRQLEENAFTCVASALKILILKYNEIKQISSSAFSRLEWVQVLLLDDNFLDAIPSKETLRPMKSLRHLSLANNRIELLDSEAFGNENANLISLNLKGNPLHHISADSLVNLVKLKTLTLSQSALSGRLTTLNGLGELRFYHLDREANLRSVPSNLCQSSRKLSSLVLKSNQLEQIPQFAQCQSLLILDLSYNRIEGVLDANFTHQPNLIDLYLGHNQLESIEERAFVGLDKLQVLELNNNNLKQIHSSAFLSVRSTIYDLNLSNNPQLTALSSLGLDKLKSLKAFGNHQLRELPRFKSAVSLALTYAYHCCDYLGGGPHTQVWWSNQQRTSSSLSPAAADSEQPRGSLIGELVTALLSKLGHIFVQGANQSYTTEHETASRNKQSSQGVKFVRNGDTNNLSELILWPSLLQQQQQQLTTKEEDQGVDLNALWKSSGVIGVTRSQIGDLSEPEVANYSSSSSSRERRFLSVQPSTPQAKHNNTAANNGRLIDELAWREVKQIRMAHSVGGANNHHKVNQGLSRLKQAPSTYYPSATAIGFQELATIDDEPIMVDFRHWITTSSATTNAKSVVGAEKEWWTIVGESDEIGLDIQQITSRSKRHLMMVGGQEEQEVLERQSQSAVVQVKCLPEPSSFLPCQDLFDTWWLRLGIWCVFSLAFTGNILVIIVLSSVRQSSSTSALTSIMWLAHSKRHIDVPRFLVINLAVADLLMALYLGILAFVDLSTLGEFKLFAIKWQYSNGCKLAGFLGVLSSELSVFILAIITLERNYAITNAVHLNRRLSLQKAMIIMFIGYTFALGMAIMPLNGISDYRKFSICLPLDMESNLSSQIYIITLIGINTFSFILLLSCYLRMYCAIRGSQAWNTNDLRIAKRMSILVVTDFLCWMPIIVVGVASLFGHHLIGTNGIKILTIFILPLNSIANPFLYAITTKKFKRDLDTLWLRIRSASASLDICCAHNKNNCYIDDPKMMFAGYNQYQHNLMMMNKRRRLVAVKGGGDFRGGAAAADSPRQQQINARRVRYARAQTFNQVTMNRTTCSCQRAAANLNLNINEDELGAGDIQAGGGHQIGDYIHSLQPKIVLDSAPTIEPIHDASTILASTSCGGLIKKSLSTNTGILSENGQQQPSVSRVGSSYVVVTTTHPDRPATDIAHASKLLLCRQEGDRLLLRPKSADVEEAKREQCSGVHTSCQAILVEDSSNLSVNNNNICEHEHRLLNVDSQVANRSASACGYHPSRRTGRDVRHHESTHQEARVSGSYDTMRTDKWSTERLSRSINRLLFSPIAKAWSSIQISLNSSVTQVAVGGHSPTTTVFPRETEAATTTARTVAAKLKRNDFNDNDSDQLAQNSTTIDDILLISSPSRRLFKINERRMSRSCDMISQHNPLLMSPASSTNEATTTTSQFDYDDDQRILLATINRIATTGGRKRGSRQPDDHELLASGQYLRNRCTRCRSWSPALLSKLEDCIYQIKCKIPGLSATKSGQSHEAMEQSESSDEDDDDDSDQSEMSCYEEDKGESGERIGPGNLRQHAYENMHDGNENSEDTFNEKGLLEWDQKDTGEKNTIIGKRKKHRLRKHQQSSKLLQQQSSTNSDTVSTQTGGTIVTNMSVSFDSNTSIPVPGQRSNDDDARFDIEKIDDVKSL